MKEYFTDSELRCKCGCGTQNLADGFRPRLNELRERVGHPLPVTSCARCAAHNTAVGGKLSSFHLTTHPWGVCAADISCAGWSSQQKWAFVKTAMDMGFSVGVNWAKNFIHIDDRAKHPTGWPEPVFFPY